MKYRVVWTVYDGLGQTFVEAESEDEAKKLAEETEYIEGHVFLVEDENGKQIIYDTI